MSSWRPLLQRAPTTWRLWSIPRQRWCIMGKRGNQTLQNPIASNMPESFHHWLQLIMLHSENIVFEWICKTTLWKGIPFTDFDYDMHMYIHHIVWNAITCQCPDSIGGSRFWFGPWWRHQMGTFSALLALCAGNSPVPVNSSHKGQWRGALMFSFICVWINDWLNNREAGDLRRHRGHYDVTVMPYWLVNRGASWALIS